METNTQSQLKVKFTEKMIPYNINAKAQSLFYFVGLLNFIGFYFFSAFLNKITIIFESAANSIFCVL